jgi:hypothetical protein
MGKVLPPLLPYEDRLVGVEARGARRASHGNAAFRRERVERAARGEGPTFASWTIDLGEEGLAIFNRLPSRAWWVRAYDLRPILEAWGLRALDGIVACGAGAPAETVPVAAHVDSPRVAPMMAEAYARLAKQRAIGEKWLFDFSQAAAIGLVPPAALGRGKARDYARGALTKLVEGGRAEIVREVAGQYGLTDALADVLAKTGAPPPKGAAPDLDEEVRDLEQRLRKATASSAAFRLFDRLTEIDTDRALFAVAELATKARSKPLRVRASQALGAVRARRGLTEDDLAVRMVPTLGLDDPEIAIGGVIHRLAASPALEPQVIAPDGTRAAALPRGAPDEVKRRWALLKKELRTLASAPRDRLERRMIAGDAWTGETFLAHVVGHPLLVELARGLVFRADGRLFRVAEDRTLADDEDRALALAPAALVAIAHPLDVDAADLRRWTERFAEYEILQPFPQLGREFFHVAVEDGHLRSLEGKMFEPGHVLGLERRGWERGEIDHGPTLRSMHRAVPGGGVGAAFEPGVRLDDVRGSPPQRLAAVRVHSTSGAPMPPRSLSEIVRDLARP